MNTKILFFLFVSSFVFLSFPALAEDTSISEDEIGNYFIRHILVETLQEQQQEFYYNTLERLQNDLEEKELIEESDPIYTDLRKAIDELNDFIDERHKTLKAKEESINRKIISFNEKADRYTGLISRYNELTKEIENLHLSQSSQVTEIQSRLNTLG